MSFSEAYFIVNAENESSGGSISADANVDLNLPPGAKGCVVLLDADTLTGSTPTLDVKIQGVIPLAAKDGSSAVYVDMPGAAFPQITTSNDNAARTLTVYPGIAETTNVSVSDALPAKVRFVLDVGGSSPVCPVTIVGWWLW